MPIALTCLCGRTLSVADVNAGRRVKCPACAAVLDAPAPKPDASKPVVELTWDEDEDGSYKVEPAVETPPDPKPEPRPVFRKRASRAERAFTDYEREGMSRDDYLSTQIGLTVGGLFLIGGGILAIVRTNGDATAVILSVCLIIGGLSAFIVGVKRLNRNI